MEKKSPSLVLTRTKEKKITLLGSYKTWFKIAEHVSAAVSKILLV